MSLKEESTDGRSGMDNAEKAKEGNYEKPVHGYNGSGSGSSSLLNKKEVRCKDSELQIKKQETEVIEQYPFIEEEDQERQFPSGGKKDVGRD